MNFKQLMSELPKYGTYVGVTESRWDDETRTEYTLYKDMEEMKQDIIAKSKLVHYNGSSFTVVWMKPVTYKLNVDVDFLQDEW